MSNTPETNTYTTNLTSAHNALREARYANKSAGWSARSLPSQDESELWEHDSDVSDIDSVSTRSSATYDYSLEDAISYIGLGKYQWGVMILAGSLWFCAAIQLMCTSILILNLKNVDAILLTNYEEGVIASVPFLGEIFGAFLLSMFSDKYGRKKAIMVSGLSLSFFSTLSALSYDFYMLVICRLMTGCAVGGSLTCLSLVAEFIPQSHRGEMTYVEVSFWSFGAIYAIAIGWLIYYAELSWRWYLAACAAPSWICVVFTLFIPESLRWLMNNADYMKVKREIVRIAQWNNVDISHLRGRLIQIEAVEQDKKGSIRSLFNKQHIRTSIHVLLTTFCATCAYFGVALFQLNYFEEEDSSISNIFWELLVCTSSEIPGMIIGIMIFDHVGRIPFLSSTFLISMLCFVGLVFSSEYVGIVLIFMARMGVSMAYNILIVYILEYYPTTIRSTALGFSITLARFAGISTSFIVQDLSTADSSIIFSVCCFIATITTFLLPTETLGRELTDDSDEGIEQLVAETLSEYDQSLPLMQHKAKNADNDNVYDETELYDQNATQYKSQSAFF